MNAFENIVMKSGGEIVLNVNNWCPGGRKTPDGGTGDDDIASADESEPFDINGGTILAIAGDDFVVVASDTRLTIGETIASRNQCKLFPLTEIAVLAITGCWGDVVALKGLLEVRIRMYEQAHNKAISTEALAQMMSILMYNRRLCPFYTGTILAGLDKEGKGAVFYYDPVGHCDRCPYRCLGTSGVMLMPTLDQAIGWANSFLTPVTIPPLTKERALAIAHNSLITASERDTHTGDMGVIRLITKSGIKDEHIKLHED